jgi:hypothetical protein
MIAAARERLCDIVFLLEHGSVARRRIEGSEGEKGPGEDVTGVSRDGKWTALPRRPADAYRR